MDLTESAINKILNIIEPKYKDVHGLLYCNKPMHIVEEPRASAFEIKTLTGIFDFIKEASGDLADPIIHIESHKKVSLFSKLNKERRREWYICAEMDFDGFNFDKWDTLESFIIDIQTLFIDGEDTYSKAELLNFLGTISSTKIEKFIDDGVTQRIHVESGMKSGDIIEIPAPQGPIKLKPFRTFREIDQPESIFQLRLKCKPGHVPNAALFEADGEMWKLEAIQRIKGWLEKRLQTQKIPIIA